MSNANKCYGIGQGLIYTLPIPKKFENAPTSGDTNYEVGQIGYTPGPTANAFYIYAGGGNWIEFADSDGPIQNILATAPVAVSIAGGVATISLAGPPNVTTLTNHGVVLGQGTSAVVATTAGTAGQVLTSGGASADPTWTTATFPATAGATGTILRSNGTNWVASTDTYPNTSTAGALIAATATNVIGEIVDVAVGQLLASGGAGVIPAYTASPSVTGNMTAATGFIATTAGAGLLLNSPAASGAAASPVVVNGRSGQATFTSVSIAAAADLTLTITNSAITGASTQVIYSMSGATTGSALSIKSVTNTAGSSAIVVTNGTGATTTTEDIVMNFLVLN